MKVNGFAQVGTFDRRAVTDVGPHGLPLAYRERLHFVEMGEALRRNTSI
jgi:hypothetical protein